MSLKMENKSRLYLRALEPDDYKVSIIWRRNDKIWNMLCGTKYFVSEAYEKSWVEKTIFNSKDLKLAVCLIDNDKYIGNVYMTNIDAVNSSCESHVLIGDEKYWGAGYAKEALLQLVSYMFNERNINRIEAHILESNIRSIKMHEKCGYKLEGLKRQAVYKNGEYQNQYILSLLKKDFLIKF